MKKIILILVSLFILCACTTIKPTKQEEKIVDISEYISKLENFEVRQKNINNTVDNEQFNDFLDEIARHYISLSYINMHYKLIDYKAYGIEKPEVKFSPIEYKFDQEEYENVLAELDRLHSFDYDSLSYRQQYDYEVLEYSDYETILDYYYWKYIYLFSSTNNLCENLESTFTNFTFYDQESIDDYFILLDQVESYLDDALAFTAKQAEDKIYLLDSDIDQVTDYCDSFVHSLNNSYIETFKKRLTDLDFIDEQTKQTYIEKNNKMVKESVIPAYQKVINELDKYRGLGKYEDRVAININENYAKYLIYLKSSCNYSIDDIFNNLIYVYNDLYDNFALTVSYEDTYNLLVDVVYGNYEQFNVSEEDALAYLRNNVYKCYPDLKEVKYSIDYLPEDIGATSTKAYYYDAPIDNVDQNIIKLNPNYVETGVDTFITLAHEGIPGHLYQRVYSLLNGAHDFRSILMFIGSSEGHAVTGQMDAYYMAGIENEAVCKALQFYYSDYFYLYSIIDIGVNYYGWKSEDIYDFYMQNDPYELYGEMDKQQAESIYEFVIENAGMYLPYGVGSANTLALRQYAAETLGEEYKLSDFNLYVLKNGVLPFNILKGSIDEYIESK